MVNHSSNIKDHGELQVRWAFRNCLDSYDERSNALTPVILKSCMSRIIMRWVSLGMSVGRSFPRPSFFCFAILSLLSFSAWIGILCVGDKNSRQSWIPIQGVYNAFGDRIGEEKTVIYCQLSPITTPRQGTLRFLRLLNPDAASFASFEPGCCVFWTPFAFFEPSLRFLNFPTTDGLYSDRCIGAFMFWHAQAALSLLVNTVCGKPKNTKKREVLARSCESS